MSTALNAAIYRAVMNAIKEVGVDAFKRTSMFGSNDRCQSEDVKKAA